MTKRFQTIGLIGRNRSVGASDTLLALYARLQAHKLNVVVEELTAQNLAERRHVEHLTQVPREDFADTIDLAIVVGGDGSLLQAAALVVDAQKPVLGINRGRLGFLTDIKPDELEKVDDVLAGAFTEEQRFMLEAQIQSDTTSNAALNDVVLTPGSLSHMIEFDIFVNDQFVSHQRADGLIVATPTGSTAYALSGGGPILHPALEAVVLVPMFPHTLSARPLVIQSDSNIKIVIDEKNECAPNLSCDGGERLPIAPGQHVIIQKKSQALRLIHPNDYNYFETLRSKLHWG